MSTDLATSMYYISIDPLTKQEVFVARQLRDRKAQRALLQFFKPENYFEVRSCSKRSAKATDLIGGGYEGMIPAKLTKEAFRGQREHANANDSKAGRADEGL